MLVHPLLLLRTSLARLLASESDFELAAECANPEEAMDKLRQGAPDVVLFDAAIRRDFIVTALEAGYCGKFLMIAEAIDAADCARLLRHGVSGVFLGKDSPNSLVQAIRVVMSGAVWVDQSVIQLLAERYPFHEDVRLDALAQRERAVLEGILGGLTNRKIGDRIGASESTVKAILQHLFNRTGVRTRSQLVRILLADAFEKHFD